MSQAAQLGSLCTGHGSFPPRPSISGSNNVFINNRPAIRVGDLWSAHCSKTCHTGRLVSGSTKVFINGLPAGRIGDHIDCGSRIAEGSPNVLIGG